MCHEDINKCPKDVTPQLDLLLAGTNPHQLGRCMYILVISIYIYTVTTFKYVAGGPDRKAPEVVWNTSSYI